MLHRLWNRLTRNRGESGHDSTAGPSYEWIEPGLDNPFPMRILDIRNFSLSVVATTSDPKVAETFDAQRQTLGKEFVAEGIPNSTTVKCNLRFPHDGSQFEGIVYKSDAMEIKWDVYLYNSSFLFVRSWSGQLRYRAFIEINSDCIRIHGVECNAEESDVAVQNVFFILATHVLGHVLPHTMPKEFEDDRHQIAVASFSMFGNKGVFATFDDITTIEIKAPEMQ